MELVEYANSSVGSKVWVVRHNRQHLPLQAFAAPASCFCHLYTAVHVPHAHLHPPSLSALNRC